MHTLRRKFVSESLMRSNLCAHNCNIRLRSSRKRNFAEIMGTRGRVCRNGDVRGGPNISESSSVALSVVFGSVIVVLFVLFFFVDVCGCCCCCCCFSFLFFLFLSLSSIYITLFIVLCCCIIYIVFVCLVFCLACSRKTGNFRLSVYCLTLFAFISCDFAMYYLTYFCYRFSFTLMLSFCFTIVLIYIYIYIYYIFSH